ncbi:MAG: glycosyltransferase family 4 protein [Actinomycetota bacterium]
MTATAPRRLAVVAPLPPAPSGIASYVARQLPVLARRVEVVLVTEDPGGVDPALRERFEVRAVDELDGIDVDDVLYHLGNSLECLETDRAVEHGPPGIVLAHDLSIHHLVAHVGLGGERPDEYRESLVAAFGERGRRLAELRIAGERGETELALFDLVGPLLRRHRAAVVHSTWAAGLVRRRAPGLPVAVVPHFAPDPVPPIDRSDLGLPTSPALIGSLGYVVPAKRPDLVVRATARLLEAGRDVHAVFGGTDATDGELSLLVDELGLGERVTITGWLGDRELRGLAGAMDAVVALRSPHLGQSSGPVPIAAIAGTPIVTWRVGAFVDIPDDACVAAEVGGDEVAGLAAALDELVSNPARRASVGAGARRWAQRELDLVACTERLLDACATAPTEAPAAVAIDRPWAVLLESRRPGRATLVSVEADAQEQALREAGWRVRRAAQPEPVRQAPVGSADLILWHVTSGSHIDRRALDALHRHLAPTGQLVVDAGSPSLGRTVAAALGSAGFGPGGGGRIESQPVDGAALLVARKVGPAGVAQR